MTEPSFLQHVFPSHQFTREEQNAIFPRFKGQHFSKNSFLHNEGSVATHYWFVQQGFVRSYVHDIEGNDISTNFYTIGDLVIDWISFFQKTPAKENIQVLTDCVVWGIDYDSFQELYHGIKTFNEHGRATMVQGYFSLKERSIAMITEQAKDRYVRLLREKPEIIQNVSLKHIATYLGITDTSLSRIRKDLMSES
jgi:CRP-like cAMP-binding protein